MLLIPGLRLQRFVQAFADNPVAREKLMASLLAAFDQRSWVTISNILVRITFGLGFGQVRGGPCAKAALPQISRASNTQLMMVHERLQLLCQCND